MVFKKSDNLINHFNAGKSPSLRLPYELGVAAAFGDEVVHVKHGKYDLVGVRIGVLSGGQ